MKTLKRKLIKAYRETNWQTNKGYCPVTLADIKLEDAVLDHDHTTGHCRTVISRNANQFLGKIESNFKRFLAYQDGISDLPTILRGIANYIEFDWSKNPYHPGWADLQVRKFSRMNKTDQSAMLIMRDISPGETSKARTKQLKNWFYEKDENEPGKVRKPKKAS